MDFLRRAAILSVQWGCQNASFTWTLLTSDSTFGYRFAFFSFGIIATFESYSLVYFPQERCQIHVFLEQDTVLSTLWKDRRNPCPLVEFDLKCSPAAVNLLYPQFTSDQIYNMKRQN